MMTHIDASTYGTYECRATDIAGNTASNFLRVIPPYKVKAKISGWNESMVSFAHIHSEG